MDGYNYLSNYIIVLITLLSYSKIPKQTLFQMSIIGMPLTAFVALHLIDQNNVNNLSYHLNSGKTFCIQS